MVSLLSEAHNKCSCRLAEEAGSLSAPETIELLVYFGVIAF